MKKLLIISLLVSQAIMSVGQELKTKKRKVNEQQGTATYFVLASNDKVMHGKYQIRAYTGNRILLSGTYNNNKKVGLWIEQYYGQKYKGPKAIGFYANDLKTGDWAYFNYEGDIVQIYNWTENKVVFSKHCGTDTSEYTVIKDGIEIRQKLDCPPTCVTGPEYFLYQFKTDIGQRATYFKDGDDGWHLLETKISITIDKNSSITEISYSTDEKKELKEIIEQYIKSYRWMPGKKDGKDMTTKFEFTVKLGSRF
jgi:hypothetical protein